MHIEHLWRNADRRKQKNSETNLFPTRRVSTKFPMCPGLRLSRGRWLTFWALAGIFYSKLVRSRGVRHKRFHLFLKKHLCMSLGTVINTVKVKVIPQQAEEAQGVSGRLRPRIFLTFGTKRVVGRQPYAPAAFTSGEISGTHFQRLSRPQGHMVPSWEFPVTPPGIDPGTSRLVAQCLNHYATPGPD